MDTRLRTEADNEYIAVIGADNWVKYRFGASALSNTQMAFNNIKPAGEKFMINTRWYIEYKTRIILTADMCHKHSPQAQQQGLQHQRAELAACCDAVHLC